MGRVIKKEDDQIAVHCCPTASLRVVCKLSRGWITLNVWLMGEDGGREDEPTIMVGL